MSVSPFSPAAIEAMFQRDMRRAKETYEALVWQAENDRERRLEIADRDADKTEAKD